MNDEDRKPVFEFIHYPTFGRDEMVNPANKIVYTLYSEELTATAMREAFNYFLKACTYHIEEEE